MPTLNQTPEQQARDNIDRHRWQETWSEQNPEGRWRNTPTPTSSPATKPTSTSSGSKTNPWPTSTTCPIPTFSPPTSSKTSSRPWKASKTCWPPSIGITNHVEYQCIFAPSIYRVISTLRRAEGGLHFLQTTGHGGPADGGGLDVPPLYEQRWWGRKGGVMWPKPLVLGGGQAGQAGVQGQRV